MDHRSSGSSFIPPSSSTASSSPNTTMAAVIRDLWGHHPKFLNIVAAKTLHQLARSHQHATAHGHTNAMVGVGLKVTRTEWFKRGMHDCYYTISHVKFDKELNRPAYYGHLTWRGSQKSAPERIRKTTKANWHLHQPTDFLHNLERKLHPVAPSTE